MTRNGHGRFSWGRLVNNLSILSIYNVKCASFVYVLLLDQNFMITSFHLFGLLWTTVCSLYSLIEIRYNYSQNTDDMDVIPTESANNTNEHCLTQNKMVKMIKKTRTTCIAGDTVICEAVAIFNTQFLYRYYLHRWTQNTQMSDERKSTQSNVLYNGCGSASFFI